MKKFLTMFAFAAAIVLGAFTLASCGGDDDDFNTTHSFTLTGKFESNLASVRNNPDFQKECADEINALEEANKELSMRMTDTQAALLWSGLRDDNKVSTLIQTVVDQMGTKYKDRTLSFTLIYKRNGSEWRSQKWVTNYKDNY